jgi:hypothetical protein
MDFAPPQHVVPMVGVVSVSVRKCQAEVAMSFPPPCSSKN